MSNEENINKAEMENLVNHYQDTRAPLGFANRVMAHVEQDSKQRTIFNPGFAVTTAVTIVALVSLVIVNSIEDKKPELQIAKQDQPTQITKPAPEQAPFKKQTADKIQKKKPVTPLAKGSETLVASVNKPVKPQVQTQTTVKITTEERELFFQTSNDTDSTSLAVLTDVSDWLTEQKDMTAPDISDLPDMGEIDSVFDTT